MAENTQNGPAGANKPALPVTPHQTTGHTDNTVGGSDESSNHSLGTAGELQPVHGD
jgi:hypothetical protein